jgi:hypothetical protein
MADKLTARKIEAFHAAIGRFMLTWASVEVGLDLLVIILSRKSTERLKPPHQLNEKLKLIRRETRALAATYRVEIVRLLVEIDALSATRHDYVHGAVIGQAIERSILTITMARLLQPPKPPRRKPVKITAAQIVDTSNRLHEIGGRLLDLADVMNKQRHN